MSFIAFLIVLAFTGLIVGAFGRLAIPGPDPMTIGQTILLGVASSWIAGLVVYAITGGKEGAGITLSIIVSAIIVYVMRRRRGGSLHDPALRRR